MTMIYKADSIRIASYQSRQPMDIGRFRPRVLQHDLHAYQIDTPEGERWACALPFGSSIGAEATVDEAIKAGVEWANHHGWTTDRNCAETGATEHAKARKNAHPNR